MRKIIDRVRRWIIKRLGGYTEQTPLRIVTHNSEIVTMCRSFILPDEIMSWREDERTLALEEIYNRVSIELAKDLLKNGLVEIETFTDLPDPGFCRRRRYVLRVAKPCGVTGGDTK